MPYSFSFSYGTTPNSLEGELKVGAYYQCLIHFPMGPRPTPGGGGHVPEMPPPLDPSMVRHCVWKSEYFDTNV